MQKNNSQSGMADIIGCRYQVSALRDSFIPMILDALGKTDTSKIWALTEKTSTVYRGKSVHVVDCVKACFSHIYDDTSPYISMSATFSKKSDDDMSKDCYIAQDDVLLNDTKKSFNVLGRISLYPLGVSDYQEHSAKVVELAVKRDVYVDEGHYISNIEGNIHDMFDFVNDVLAYGNENIDNYSLNVTMVIYGPEAREEKA